jgi:hypothetical protein
MWPISTPKLFRSFPPLGPTLAHIYEFDRVYAAEHRCVMRVLAVQREQGDYCERANYERAWS